MKLYVFDHCPYSIRARMVAALSHLSIEVHYLALHDVTARTHRIHRNQLPILEHAKQTYLSDSDAIIAYLNAQTPEPLMNNSPLNAAIQAKLANLSHLIPALFYPRLSNLNVPEIQTQADHDYLHQHKSLQLGSPLSDLMQQSHQIIAQVQPLLTHWHEIPTEKKCLSWDHLYLFSALRNLTAVQFLTFNEATLSFLFYWSKRTKIPLYFDRAH